jgi:hypothetical protein
MKASVLQYSFEGDDHNYFILYKKSRLTLAELEQLMEFSKTETNLSAE